MLRRKYTYYYYLTFCDTTCGWSSILLIIASMHRKKGTDKWTDGRNRKHYQLYILRPVGEGEIRDPKLSGLGRGYNKIRYYKGYKDCISRREALRANCDGKHSATYLRCPTRHQALAVRKQLLVPVETPSLTCASEPGICLTSPALARANAADATTTKTAAR